MIKVGTVRRNHQRFAYVLPGSHEVFVSYAFKFTTTPVENKYANPRFL